ncbi:MAG: hypothetical protein ABI634_18600 [Acidobacteriota bacterium]
MGDVTVNIHIAGSEVDVLQYKSSSGKRADSKMTVEFRGLCAFIERPKEKRYEVYFPTGLFDTDKPCDAERVRHLTALAIPTMAVNPDKSAHPLQVVTVDGREIGIWLISDELVTFSTAGTELPTWDTTDVFDLYDLHKQRVKPKGRIDQDFRYGVLFVSGGTLTSHDIHMFKYTQDNTEHEKSAATNIVWSLPSEAPPTIRFDGKPKIVLREATTITVTNVSPAGAGMQHFAYYYTLIDSNIECQDRVVIDPHDVNRSENTYGCTPPTTGS